MIRFITHPMLSVPGIYRNDRQEEQSKSKDRLHMHSKKQRLGQISRVIIPLDGPLLVRSDGRLEMVQRLAPSVLALQNPPVKPVRKGLGELIVHVRTGRDGEDVIKLLERPLLRLRNPEENHDKGGDVEEGVEAKSALRLEGRNHLREGDGKSRGPEQTGRHRPAHADLTVG